VLVERALWTIDGITESENSVPSSSGLAGVEIEEAHGCSDEARPVGWARKRGPPGRAAWLGCVPFARCAVGRGTHFLVAAVPGVWPPCA
jgi:hypothetical protein